jgi:hypothetical protein
VDWPAEVVTCAQVPSTHPVWINPCKRYDRLMQVRSMWHVSIRHTQLTYRAVVWAKKQQCNVCYLAWVVMAAALQVLFPHSSLRKESQDRASPATR